jgi:hypothetical protein
MRELTGSFCAFFSGLIAVVAIVALFSGIAMAQNDAHQLAPDTMKVPDSLAHPDNQAPAAAPNQGDQLSDSDAKKKELDKLTPNIAIEPETHGPNNITDIMNLIASMPQGVQERLMADAAQAKDYCEHNVLLGSFYDCSCFSLEIVNDRIKKGPDGALMDIMENGQYKECVSMPKIAGYGLNRCDRTLTTMSVTTGQLNDICDCAARMLARNYAVKPMPNILYINYLFTNILSVCRAQYGF